MNIEERFAIYNEIKKEVKEKHGEDLSIEEIDSIVQSQFKIMVYGFSKNLTTAIPYIGKFIPLDRKHYEKTLIIPSRIRQQELIDEGKEKEAKAELVKSLEKFKSLLSAKKNQPFMTAQEVISIVNVDNVPDSIDIFKNIR